MELQKIPRVQLASLPTPLIEASNLSDVLRGPRIFIKRDDMTGLAMGGNKARKLEFVLADALQKDADVLITTGSSQSNFAMQMAAAGCKLGMESILVLFKGRHPEVQGNFLLNNILGVEVRLMDGDLTDLTEIYKAIDQLADELKTKGRHPYVVPAGADIPLGAIGYVVAAQEINQQVTELNIAPDYICLANGYGGTQSGLSLGIKHFNMPFKVIGNSIACDKEECQKFLTSLCNDTAELLGLDTRMSPEEFIIYDNYIGDGYGIPTREGLEAIKLLAKTEGIFLDPVYTSKAMAGLIDLINEGKLTSNDTVIFLHTGGVPALFAYDKEVITQ